MKRNGIISKLFSILVFVFLYAPILVLVAYITGHCSVGYSLAAACENRIKGAEEPQKWNVAFWLILAGAVSLGLCLVSPEALTPLQTVSILFGFPVCFAILALVLSFFRQLKKDFPEGLRRGPGRLWPAHLRKPERKCRRKAVADGREQPGQRIAVPDKGGKDPGGHEMAQHADAAVEAEGALASPAFAGEIDDAAVHAGRPGLHHAEHDALQQKAANPAACQNTILEAKYSPQQKPIVRR